MTGTPVDIGAAQWHKKCRLALCVGNEFARNGSTECRKRAEAKHLYKNGLEAFRCAIAPGEYAKNGNEY